ncbi:hypothetical protein, partial [Escherichia coli]|uniref:hypothetical protein n=1 Tax=Escherichia coli TaxID=562 RepID=UPI0003EF4372
LGQTSVDRLLQPIRPTNGTRIVGLISVAHQAFVTIAGCGVNALSGLRMAREFVGLISVAHQAVWRWS